MLFNKQETKKSGGASRACRNTLDTTSALQQLSAAFHFYQEWITGSQVVLKIHFLQFEKFSDFLKNLTKTLIIEKIKALGGLSVVLIFSVIQALMF